MRRLGGRPRRRARGLETAKVWRSWIALLVLFLPGASLANNHQESADDFFQSTNLLTFRVELDETAFDELTEKPRTYVRGRVRVGDRTWEDVGIRLKGSGTFQPIYSHPSLTLKFNWKEAGQRFDGLSKLFLENSAQDATRMCKLVSNGAYTDAGIAAPRITQARVQVNGRDLGRYVVSEAINKGFLESHFGNASGNLYESDFRDIYLGLKQANGRPSDQSDLRALARAAALTNVVERADSLSRLLDTEEFLNFLAIEMILGNWDGYAFQQNNYRLYHNPASGLIVFIPHDLDNTIFESGICLMPPRNGILTAAFLDTPEGRERFRSLVCKLAPRVLDPLRVKQRVDASIARMTQGADSDEQAAIHRHGALLEQRAAERLEHITNELAGKNPPTPVFDSNGVAVLTGWTAKTDWNGAQVKITTEDDKSALTIEAAGDYCFGSWRLAVWLPAGRYRVEGWARAEGAAGLPSQTGSGVGVRVLGTRRGSGIQGDCSRWTPVRHDFIVQEDCNWVELVAELRAFSGTAWFDSQRFRLLKLR